MTTIRQGRLAGRHGRRLWHRENGRHRPRRAKRGLARTPSQLCRSCGRGEGETGRDPARAEGTSQSSSCLDRSWRARAQACRHEEAPVRLSFRSSTTTHILAEKAIWLCAALACRVAQCHHAFAASHARRPAFIRFKLAHTASPYSPDRSAVFFSHSQTAHSAFDRVCAIPLTRMTHKPCAPDAPTTCPAW